MYDEEKGFGKGSYKFGEKNKKFSSSYSNPIISVDSDYDSVGLKNGQMDNVSKAYEKQAKTEEGVYLGEDKMFTGNAWVDMGIAAGRAYKKKKNAKK